MFKKILRVIVLGIIHNKDQIVDWTKFILQFVGLIGCLIFAFWLLFEHTNPCGFLIPVVIYLGAQMIRDLKADIKYYFIENHDE